MKKNVLFQLLENQRTVFRLGDVAMLTGSSDFRSLNNKMNYYVRTGQLLNPRKGIYTKRSFKPEELACSIYTPCYISLEYVLQREGIIFQYDSRITLISYLSRTIQVGEDVFSYRKIKGSTLINVRGIHRGEQVNIASCERAFLDLLYLEPDYYFDNLGPLNRDLIGQLLPIYDLKRLNDSVNRLFHDDGY